MTSRSHRRLLAGAGRRDGHRTARVLTPSPSASGRLPKWSGTPLDPANHGSFLEAGTLFCLVGDPERPQGVAPIDQSDVDFVRPGQRVKIELAQLRPRTIGGTITEIAKLDLQADAGHWASLGELPARRDASGAARPLTTAYQARLCVDEHDEQLTVGAPGRCKITVTPQSLGQRRCATSAAPSGSVCDARRGPAPPPAGDRSC